MESCFNRSQWMSSHTQTSSQFISGVRADLRNTALSLLRSSTVKIPSSNIWGQQELFCQVSIYSLWPDCEILIRVGATVTLWDSIECDWFPLLVGHVDLGHVDVRKQFFFAAQWTKMRLSCPLQVSRGHLWQCAGIQTAEHFKLSA